MDKLAIGKVRTSHGLTGAVKFYSYSGEYDHFTKLKDVLLKKGASEKTMVVEKCTLQNDLALLKFKGIDTPEAAKLLADSEIWVDRNLAAPLEGDEVYLSDLKGCSLMFEGQAVATVTGFMEGAAQIMLTCRTPDDREVLVPYHSQFLGKVDVAGRTIELLVDWILE